MLRLLRNLRVKHHQTLRQVVPNSLNGAFATKSDVPTSPSIAPATQSRAPKSPNAAPANPATQATFKFPHKSQEASRVEDSFQALEAHVALGLATQISANVVLAVKSHSPTSSDLTFATKNKTLTSPLVAPV